MLLLVQRKYYQHLYILKRYFNISRICCKVHYSSYLIFMWPFVPDKKIFFHKIVSKVLFFLQQKIEFTFHRKNLKYYRQYLAAMLIKKNNFKTTSMRHTHIMIYIDWSENGLLILLFQDNNGIYSLVMTLKAYNSNNRKKSSTKIRDQV